MNKQAGPGAGRGRYAGPRVIFQAGEGQASRYTERGHAQVTETITRKLTPKDNS